MAVALITGGTRGIGLACARALRADGMRVAVCGRDAGHVASAAAETDLARICDVSDRDALGAFAGEVAGVLGGIDVVVANAGVLPAPTPVTETAPDVWNRLLAVNLVGVSNTLAACIRHLRASAGYAFVIGSVSGHEGEPGLGAYGSTKWAVRGLVQAFLREEHAHGVRATVIAPGLVDTDMGATVEAPGDPLPPEDVARTVRWCLGLSRQAIVREVLLEREAAL